jgi:hypothetical protein
VSTPALVSSGRRFWPVGEAAQADYEALRAQALATGAAADSLIAWPSAEPVFDAALLGASRPPWTPHADPRLDALAAGFALLLNAGRDTPTVPTDTVIDKIKELPG